MLDGCGYYIFKSVYKSFFPESDLKKRISTATGTYMWARNNFKDKDCSDIIYISPIVNTDNWLPNNNFFKIVMSWKTQWNAEYGTVMADGTTKVARSVLNENLGKRVIIHYLQPHQPYIGFPPKFKLQALELSDSSEKIKAKIRRKVVVFWTKHHLPNTWLWRITNLLDINSIVAQLYADKGWKGVRDAYTDNLRYVLKYVTEIANAYPEKKIVITSDHGERLGEFNMFGHGGRRDKVVIEVPWLEVKKSSILEVIL